MIKYSEYEDLRKLLIGKKIVKWTTNELILEDGTRVSVECSEYDCCAYAGGTFKDIELDAIITEITYPAITKIPDDDTRVNEAKVVIYHNQNPIAQLDAHANAGNGGYYYSVCAFVVKEVDSDEKYYKIVSA